FSYACVPVLSGDGDGRKRDGRLVGALVLQFRRKNGASQAALRIAERIAAILGPNFERALPLARERRLAMLLATSGDAMFAWDREGRITDANDAAACLTGVARNDLIGVPIADLLDPPPSSSRPSTPAQGVRLELLARRPQRRVVVAATITTVEDD